MVEKCRSSKRDNMREVSMLKYKQKYRNANISVEHPDRTKIPLVSSPPNDNQTMVDAAFSIA